MRPLTLPCALVTALAGLAASASAQSIPPEVILASSAHTMGARSQVPASADFPELAGARFKNFNNYIVRTPDGTRFIAIPSLDTASPTTPALNGQTDQILLVGTFGNNLTLSVVAHEGVSEVEPGRFLGLSAGIPYPSINNFLQWAIATRTHVAGATPGTVVADPATNHPDRVVKFDPTAPVGSRFTVLARANTSAESAFGAGTGANWGTTSGSTMVFNFAQISQTGVGSFVARPVFTGTISSSAIITNDATAAPVIGSVTEPAGQLNMGTDKILNVDQGTTVSYFATPDGLHTLYKGVLNNTAQDSVVVRDGSVAFQEGSSVPGLAGTVSAIAQAYMEPNGDWFVRGTNTDGATTTTWITRNGVPIAVQGQPVAPNATETWAAFNDVHGNNAGRTIITGTINGAPSANQNEVIVLAGVRLLAREGDAADLDGDGVADAGVFMGSFADRGTIGSDLRYYLPTRVKTTAAGSSAASSGLGGTTDSAIMRIRMCWADHNDNGQVELLDIFAFLNRWFAGNPAADFNRQNGVDLLDIFGFLNAWFSGC